MIFENFSIFIRHFPYDIFALKRSNKNKSCDIFDNILMAFSGNRSMTANFYELCADMSQKLITSNWVFT